MPRHCSVLTIFSLRAFVSCPRTAVWVARTIEGGYSHVAVVQFPTFRPALGQNNGSIRRIHTQTYNMICSTESQIKVSLSSLTCWVLHPGQNITHRLPLCWYNCITVQQPPSERETSSPEEPPQFQCRAFQNCFVVRAVVVALFRGRTGKLIESGPYSAVIRCSGWARTTPQSV